MFKILFNILKIVCVGVVVKLVVNIFLWKRNV